MGVCARYHRDGVPDETWTEFYARLIASGRERASIYNRPRMTPAQFIAMIRNAAGPYFLLTWNGEMAGVMHFDEIYGKSANGHFAFLPLPALRHESGIAAPVALARFGVSSLLYDQYCDGNYVFDVFIAKNPAWNKPTVKLLSYAGATVLGEIPHSCYCHDSGRNSAGVISYFTRETVRPEWTEY